MMSSCGNEIRNLSGTNVCGSSSGGGGGGDSCCYFDTANNSFQATNESNPVEPADSINIMSDVDSGALGSTSLGNNLSTAGQYAINIGAFTDVSGDSAVNVGVGNGTVNRSCVSFGRSHTFGTAESLVNIGIDNHFTACSNSSNVFGSGARLTRLGTRSTVVGHDNEFESDTVQDKQLIIGNSNKLGAASITMSAENMIFGLENEINRNFPPSSSIFGHTIVGRGNIVDGHAAIVFGDDNGTGVFDDAIIIGKFVQVSGNGAICIANESNNTAENAITIGNDATSVGVRAIAFGTTADARNDNSISIGPDSNALADNNISIGNTAHAQALRNIVIAPLSTVSSNDVILMGHDTAGPTQIGETSVVFGNSNNVANSTPTGKLVIHGHSNSVGSISGFSENNTIMGHNNFVQTDGVDGTLSAAGGNTIFGSDNEARDGHANIIVGHTNRTSPGSGQANDCILIGNNIDSSISQDGELVLGGPGQIQKIKINNIPSGTGGDPVYYDTASKELYYNSSGGGGGGAFNHAAGSLTFTSTGSQTVSGLSFEPKKVNFYYQWDPVNYVDVRVGTGTANNTFTYYNTWQETIGVPTTGIGSIPGGTVCIASNATTVLIVNMTSINSDGFTVDCPNFTNWTSGNPVVFWEAMG